MNNIVSAGAIIIDKGKILLVQEAEEPFRGKWNFPLGQIEHKELATQAALREIKEETGITVELTHFIGVFQHNPTDQTNIYIIMFVAKPLSSDIKVDPKETMAAKWFTLQEFSEIDDSELFHPAMRNTVDRAFNDPKSLDNYGDF